ncbi:MAG: PEP-CTERM sorting domain-containing protein [Gammaproteobacteria bacterium]|nr:PEP-CTERM sorting domain-containing protein [Gammaproteobacteria bacterium]
MDTLRAFLSACAGTRRNGLTTLVLFLAGAPLASAQQHFTATTGSADANGGGVSYTVGGPSFSTSGVIQFDFGAPIGSDNPFGPGKLGELIFYGDTANPNLDMFSLTVQGVPWSYPMGTPLDGQASVGFTTNSSNLLISGPGAYLTTFTFFESLLGAPESVVSANPTLGCDQIKCSLIGLTGGGTATLDVVPYPGIPGSLEISEVTMTFTAPEPSTTWLLLTGVGGLALLRWRSKPRETLLAV